MGEAGFSDRPFYAGSLFGMRSFGVRGEGPDAPLTSLFHSHFWSSDTNTAICMMQPRLKQSCGGNHGGTLGHVEACYVELRCPGLVSQDCDCGFWAYTNGQNDYHSNRWGGIGREAHIRGIIEGFGKCVVGPRGFRCEKARLRALILPLAPNVTNDKVKAMSKSAVEARMDWLTKRVRSFYPNIPVFLNEYLAVSNFPLTPFDVTTQEESQA